ncbi:MAG: hypothetical protein ABI645_16650 [Pseudomonadota bacterium]
MTGRFRYFRSMTVVLAMGMLLQSAMADTAETTPPTQQLDEIVVKTDHLNQIRQAMLETENRFYARYNQLNTDDDFDVDCARTASLGSRIQGHRCEIAFYAKAREQESSAYLAGYYAPAAELVYLERIVDYRKNALKLINSDLQLRKLVRQREDLGKLYTRRQKEIFAHRWIDW